MFHFYSPSRPRPLRTLISLLTSAIDIEVPLSYSVLFVVEFSSLSARICSHSSPTLNVLGRKNNCGLIFPKKEKYHVCATSEAAAALTTTTITAASAATTPGD